MLAVRPLGSAIRGWRQVKGEALVGRALSRGFAGENVGKGQGADVEGLQEQQENHREGREATMEDRRLPVGEIRGEKSKMQLRKETGNKPKGPEPTRYGDWERAGRCSDF